MEPPDIASLLAFMPFGYSLTVAIELPVLLLGLSPHHSFVRKIIASFWLTACTYPFVALVLPLTVWQPFGYTPYIAIAETFAPLAECFLFSLIVQGSTDKPYDPVTWRDWITIVFANLASFLFGGQIVEWISHR